MTPSRFTILLFTLLCLCAVVSFAQAGDAGIARPTTSTRAPISAANVQNGALSAIVLDADTGAVVSGGFHVTLNANASSSTSQTFNDDRFFVECLRPNKSHIYGVDSIATFQGGYAAQAGPDNGFDFQFTMMGNEPNLGCTTVYPGNIAEVSWQLLNADGSVFMNVPFAPFEKLFMESPNFEPLNYRSGRGIEFGDAVHRAQFFNVMKSNWHTLLIPQVKNKVTITVPFFVNIQLSNGTVVQARSFFTGTAADGSTFVLMLRPLFNFFFDNEVVNEIVAGNFTTNGMNMTLFPNTFLFNLNLNDPTKRGSCCVLGFHTYFRDPSAFPEPRWVTQYASWISPGIFGGGFEDVTALSHELAESYGNPFVNNRAPNWQFPGVPATQATCQNNLEEGDPIEVLANATTPITVTEGAFHFTYHPQNIPLLQWFEMGPTSNAIDGAFSFPDETALPHSALPCPNGVG